MTPSNQPMGTPAPPGEAASQLPGVACDDMTEWPHRILVRRNTIIPKPPWLRDDFLYLCRLLADAVPQKVRSRTELATTRPAEGWWSRSKRTQRGRESGPLQTVW